MPDFPELPIIQPPQKPKPGIGTSPNRFPDLPIVIP